MPDIFTDRLKGLIIATLKLEGVRPEDIPDDEALIGTPRFGLDSIDALELVLAIEKEFGVKIGSSEESRLALGSVNTLAAYLRSHPPGEGASQGKPVGGKAGGTAAVKPGPSPSGDSG